MPTSPVTLQPPNRLLKANHPNVQNPAVKQWADYSMSRQQNRFSEKQNRFSEKQNRFSEKQNRTGKALGFIGTGTRVLGNDIAMIRTAPVTDSTIEPPGSIPIHIKGRLSGWGEPPNISTHLDTQRIQNALRAAERGEMTLLHQIYRDYLLANSHLQSEFSKRVVAVVGQPYSLKPFKYSGDKKPRPEDEKACQAIEAMIEGCDNWQKGIINLMQATLYPASACEKIVAPNAPGSEFYDDTMPNLRWHLKNLNPVSPFLMSYKLPYLAAGGFELPMNVPNVIAPNAIPLMMNEPQDTIWNPDSWEPDLRFFRTFPNGYIDYSWANMYAPDPMRHIIHRGDVFSGSVRDNFGGVMRATLFWSFFMLDARTKFAQAMGKYGQPFIVAKANMSDANTVNLLETAFNQCAQVGGLLVPKDAVVELVAAMHSNLAQGWEIFMKFCNSEISKLVIGHEMSTTTKPGGLNEGETDQAQSVREDIRIFDQMMLRNTLRELFRWFLTINGIPGKPPMITWGGLGEEDASMMMEQVSSAKAAGLQLSDEGIEKLNEVSGMDYERAEEPENDAGGNPDKKNAKKK